MACTLSNRETFLVMNWLDGDPSRMSRVRAEAERLAKRGIETAIPQMSDFIYEELRTSLPQVDGLFAALLSSGLSRVNFMELAHAVLTNETSATVLTPHR